MSQWNIKASARFILGCVVFLMLLIVVLPGVDLPDAAFHQGTAPVVVHTQATTAPAAVTLDGVFQLSATAETFRPSYQPGALAVSPDPNFRPILLRSIRC